MQTPKILWRSTGKRFQVNSHFNHVRPWTFWNTSHVLEVQLTAKQVQMPLQSFNLFFTYEMLEPAMEKFSDLLRESDKYPSFWKLEKTGISAFIELLYLHTAFLLNLRETLEIWNPKTSHEIFSATMSYNQFQYTCKFITFDDKFKCNNQWKIDKSACLQELFELMNEWNTKCLFPSPLLAVDETLYPYLGATGFKQYKPKKLAKYGLLYCCLYNSSVSYTHYILPYAEKSEVRTGDSSKNYVTGTLSRKFQDSIQLKGVISQWIDISPLSH